MSTFEKRPDPLVEHLKTLAEPPDRAALASLRASLQEERTFDGLRLVLRFIPEDTPASERRRREDDALLLAGLFALHPEIGDLSLGAAMRRVMSDTKSESVEGRFQALLSASREDLPQHLRHAITLIASNPKPTTIDWADLHTALRFWDGDISRRQWARDFWVSDDAPEQGNETDETKTKGTEP